MSDRQKLDSILRFANAAVSMGNIQVNRAQEEFDETGHSCYTEGWARGYLSAVEMLHKYIADTIAEVYT